MFDFLAEEVETIKTRKFHLVDGPADARLRRAIKTTKLSAPKSFKEFALQFGNAQLYRFDNLDLYRVTVYAAMRETSTKDGEPLFGIGKNDMHFAYFKADLLKGDKESPVFEWIAPSGYLRPAADGFEEWLEKRCQNARKKYNKRRWEEIRRGPEPLTEEERAMLAARKKYKWRIVGIAKNRNVQFEVFNGSKTRIPVLSIGLRGPTIGEGGVVLRVADIPPGTKRVVEIDCYKDCEPPETIKPFPYTDLGPEDRNYFDEFRKLPRRSQSPSRK